MQRARQRGETLHMLFDARAEVDDGEIVIFLQFHQRVDHRLYFIHRQRRQRRRAGTPRDDIEAAFGIVRDRLFERMPPG